MRRVRVGRGEVGRGERLPSQSSLPCPPVPKAWIHWPTSSHPSGPAPSLCMEGAVHFCRDQLTFGQGQLRPGGNIQALVAAAA